MRLGWGSWIAIGSVGIILLSVTFARASVSDPADIAATPAWTDDDFRTVERIAHRFRMNPADFLLMLAGESNLNPMARNPLGAVGLNQLTSAANSTAGITEAQRQMIPTLSVTAQLPIVERFFSNIQWTKDGRSYDNACMLWEANFSPGYMYSRGTSLDTILYSKLANPDAYDGNKGLDRSVPPKGYITVGDLCYRLKSVSRGTTYQSALRRLRAVTGRSYSPNLGGL
jgi:hypothetical protein